MGPGGLDEVDHAVVDLASVGSPRRDGSGGGRPVGVDQVLADGVGPFVVGEDAELGQVVVGEPVDGVDGVAGQAGMRT